MHTTVLGSFSETDSAEKVIENLTHNGYTTKDIGVIAMESVVTKPLSEANVEPMAERVAEGAVSGATTGGVIGGLAGLVIGLTAITIPGLGALLIGGPIAAALGLTGAAATAVTGVATGAAAGGLIGALAGVGVPDDVAHRFEERVRSGGVVIAVPVTDDQQAADVETLLTNGGAQDVTRAEVSH